MEKKSTNTEIACRRHGNFCYDFVKVTGVLPVLAWLRPKIWRPFGNKVPRGGVLISSNHLSLIDPIIVHCAIPSRRLHSLATKDLYTTRLRAAFFNRMHCIMIDKQNFTLSAFHDVVERLQEGRAVVIFPEGQVNRDGAHSMLAFKSGAVLMAHKSGVPILPMYIVKRERWYQRQHVVVGKPVDIPAILGERPSMEDMNRASELLRESELELRAYYEARRTRRNRKKNAGGEENV